jgi:hypothetical protein
MDIFKSNLVVGIGAALAVTVLAPVLIPAISTVGRPLAKSLLKAGLMLYEKSREAVAVAGESVEDLVAEIRAEDATREAGPAPAPAAPAAAPTAPMAAAAGGSDAVPGAAAGGQPPAGIAPV